MSKRCHRGRIRDVSTLTMKIRVTGAKGCLGTKLVRQLVKSGETVKAFVRPAANLDTLKEVRCEIFCGDISSSADIAGGLQDCDAVVHAASTTTVKPVSFDYYKK